MMMAKLLRVAVICSLCLLTFGTDSRNHWNALKVRFGEFRDLPRTESEAVRDGFRKVSDCDAGKFRGKQYVKDGDPAVIPLYDANGYIAGLQTGIPNGLPNNYPSPNMQPPFIADGDYYKLTAYFVHPTVICHGRSEQQFRRTGTGQDLYIQIGPKPETDLLEIIEHEKETTWVKGLCFPKMGFHYFREVSKNMSCDTFYPVALLYYNGQLQGFVWSLGAILNSTYIEYEKPEPEFFEKLLVEVPTCLQTLRRSTLHVYFRDNVDTLSCKHDEISGSSGAAMSFLERLLVYGLPVLLFVTNYK